MTGTRKIEIFSAGCPACEDVIALVERIRCPSCEVAVLDMHDPIIAERAKGLGVRRTPAVLVDGKLATCCAGEGPTEAGLRAVGIGSPR